MKSKYVVKLRGVICGVTAKTHQAADVMEFWGNAPSGAPDYFKVGCYKEESTGELVGAVLVTPKGSYPLTFEPARGIWTCKAAGYTVEATLKKVVGEMRCWY
jgi:hypothetical protein